MHGPMYIYIYIKRRFMVVYLSQYGSQLVTRVQIHGRMSNFSPPLHRHHYFFSTFTFSVGAGSQTWSFPPLCAYFQGLINYCIYLFVYLLSYDLCNNVNVLVYAASDDNIQSYRGLKCAWEKKNGCSPFRGDNLHLHQLVWTEETHVEPGLL